MRIDLIEMKNTFSIKYKLIIAIILPIVIVGGTGFYILTSVSDNDAITEIDYHMSLLSDEMAKRVYNIL